MTTEEGAFCASLDADSEGEEGKFYVWSLAEIEAVLGKDDAAFFAAHYDVTREGNFEGHNILNRLKHLPRNMEDESRLAPLREKLLAARAARVRPGLDDKVLADWNGLMIAGLVNAGVAFDEPTWVEHGRPRLPVHRRQDGAWRPARPFLARRPAAGSRPRLRSRRHDPGGAGAARGDRRARLSRARAGLAGGTGPALCQSRQRRLFPHRRRRRGPGGAAERHHRRRHAEPERGGGTEPGPARGLTGQHAWRDKSDRLFDGDRSRARAKTCSRISRCSMPWTCACAPPRSW